MTSCQALVLLGGRFGWRFRGPDRDVALEMERSSLLPQAEPCREGDFRSNRLPLWALSRSHGKILRGSQRHHEVTERWLSVLDVIMIMILHGIRALWFGRAVRGHRVGYLAQTRLGSQVGRTIRLHWDSPLFKGTA